MKRFFNTRETIVTEALDGFLRSAAGQHLCRLDGYPDTCVIMQREPERGLVSVISGGGSGHEPAHAGFVGRGMLTAAVCGALFASPCVDAIVAAILATTGEAGCLLVVKNYTGDRLNFGLAAERARALGKQVEMVIVGDDIALPDSATPRGVAGTVLAHKLAGYGAAQGWPLTRVAQFVRDGAGRMRTIGMALEDCNPYEPGRASRLAADEAELGLGIHGEPGAQRIALASASDLMRRVTETLEASLPATVRNTRFAVVLNNLGCVPEVEMALLLEAFSHTRLARRVSHVIGPAPLMTALDMNGFSLTLIELDESITHALQAPAQPPAWPGMVPLGSPAVAPMPVMPDAFPYPASTDPTVRAMLEHGAKVLIANEAPLNELDGKIGDGDAGSTFAGAAREITAALDRLPMADPHQLMTTVSNILTQHAGGSSGVLFAIMFSAAGRSRAPWREALREGLEHMMACGGAKPGDRTMIDALYPALEALARTGSLTDAALAARKGADATTTMETARAGRAAYVPSAHVRNVPDPGAEAVARLLEGLARG
ncbi:dihydroxyacetone kinase subunit DhaK [Komagataeibacter rhaeticus]|uniref:DAK2 domain-containing protein n=1 Tax=Komagataeibacter rhaeticus TaxID=215221 RepID=A0A181CAS8_9PROT|nr:dihydroxyacetone kinase subunit DhaK [Komagataeibacter rhaeticus]ATU72632.1 dihydroxyacetone kinase [Komagataeibacter xylinus]QIP35454.1 DAK2 domain-containing protein [Komagataeibacter rhaeticus]QOC45209.1 dihydroxyacetone kinase subunit DhaK [Komagataeibacter rhaeticus]WPP22391.1 dihydroxyacetone kinase subunit DhaK [Komagataeibacter rhaeticus]SAY48689.1 Dihydroxyacetone kinase [Komagataeibacter rhaeticus]